MCDMSPVTYLVVPTFVSMLKRTAFVLKPLKARRKKTFGDATAGGLQRDRQTTHGHSNLYSEKGYLCWEQISPMKGPRDLGE